MNIVMNLDGGMTLQLHPTEPKYWKTGTTQAFTITVELQFQYVVIDA